MRGGNLASLDVLRGGAALYVTAYHAVGSLTPSGLRFDSRGGSAHLLLRGNPLGLFGFGLYPVLAFFVLSGFVIHLRQAQRPELVARGRLAWTLGYGWRRAMRIYPPLVAAIALTAALTALGSRLFPGWPWAAGTLSDVRNVLVPVYGAASFGNDLALWSIAYELWFYVAYVPVALGLAGLGASGRVRMGAVLAGSLVLAALLVLVEDHAPEALPGAVRPLTTFAVYFPAWAVGAFVAELHTAGVRLRRRWWAVAAAAVLVGIAAPHSGNDLRPAVDLLWGLAACLVVAALALRHDRACGAEPGARGRAGRWAAGTAAWSYSLYLVHLPVILFAQAALGDGVGRISNPLVVLAVFLAAVAAGWLFAQAVERPSIALMRRSGHPVRSPPPPSSPAGPGRGSRRP